MQQVENSTLSDIIRMGVPVRKQVESVVRPKTFEMTKAGSTAACDVAAGLIVFSPGLFGVQRVELPRTFKMAKAGSAFADNAK